MLCLGVHIIVLQQILQTLIAWSITGLHLGNLNNEGIFCAGISGLKDKDRL